VVGPYPPEILNIPFTSISTFDLLMSSLMMVLALAAVQRGDLKWGKIWLFSTALLGLVFLGGQVIEFTEFVHKGLTIGTNLFGCTFFVLTGTHGAHVTVGVLWLLTLWVRARRVFPSGRDRKSTRLNSSHGSISYAVFCLKKKITKIRKNIWYACHPYNNDEKRNKHIEGKDNTFIHRLTTHFIRRDQFEANNVPLHYIHLE